MELQNGLRKSSNKAAVIAGTVVAAVILLIGIVLILAHFESQLSPAVLELAILGATVAALLAVSTVIYHVIHGPLPPPPTSVPEEKGERRSVRRAALLALLAWVIFSAIMFMQPAVGAGTFSSIFILLIGFPILFAFYLVARRRDLNVTSMMAHPWVHWEYERETWRGFAEAQTDARLRKVGKQTPRLVAGPEGLLTGDRFLAWREPGTYLTKAWRTPAAVVFRFEVSLGKGDATLDMAAPIPAGAERDVRRLQERLQSLGLRAEVRLV